MDFLHNCGSCARVENLHKWKPDTSSTGKRQREELPLPCSITSSVSFWTALWNKRSSTATFDMRTTALSPARLSRRSRFESYASCVDNVISIGVRLQLCLRGTCELLLRPFTYTFHHAPHIILRIARMQTYSDPLLPLWYSWMHHRPHQVSPCLEMERECVGMGCEERAYWCWVSRWAAVW